MTNFEAFCFNFSSSINLFFMKSEWPNAFFHRAKSLQDCCCDRRVFNQIDLVNLITEYFNTAQYSISIPYLSFKRLPGRKS